MTILNSNQDWPQVQVAVFDPSIGVFGGYKHKIVDKSVVDIVVSARDKIYYKESRPTTLFAGPRAWRKIQDLISKSNWIVTETTDIFERRKKEFLGLELILTLDDGLWIM